MLSYGINIYDNKGVGIVHAEVNAIENLPTRAYKKKLQKINILVIRTSKNGKIGISKPCAKCLYDLSTIPQNKGYVIKDIFYSNNEGLIIKNTLNKLINNDDHHISRFYRKNNYKNPFI